VEAENKQYKVSDDPIKDKSILGSHGQKMCDCNIDVHWLTAVTAGQ